MDRDYIRTEARRAIADELPPGQRGDQWEPPEDRLPSVNGRAVDPMTARMQRDIDKARAEGKGLLASFNYALTNAEDEAEDAKNGLLPVSLGDLIAQNPTMREPVIDGLLRQGETMNLIAAPKVGKSWTVAALAFAKATGRPWLGFETTPGDVLIIDNELHRETIASRLRRVAGDNLAALENHVHVLCLRGKLKTLGGLGMLFKNMQPGRFSLVIVDAFYRTIPSELDENKNADMAGLYNLIDQFADHLQSSFVLIHHASKGNQSGKGITDVGSGAGSQSRAADTHLILRQHKEDNAVVLEAVVRSFPPVAPKCLRWEFPAFSIATDLDPTDLREAGPRGRKKTDPTEPPKPVDPPWTAQRFADAFGKCDPRPRSLILEDARLLGLSGRLAEQLLQAAIDRNLLFAWRENGANTRMLVANCPPISVSPENEKGNAKNKPQKPD